LGLPRDLADGPADEPDVSARNCNILPSGELDAARPETWRGSIDRSPCGTGTSARMACLHARGELDLKVPFVHQGVLGTTFEGMLHERVQSAGHDAVIPSIRGRAWITGFNQHILHPDDPFPRGYTVGDVWGDSSF
jgi:proline racemase